jgi:glucan 1,3-beta-glucosidase
LEGCEDANPGWCFKNAVGKSLPSSFTFKTKRALADGDADPTKNCVLYSRQDRSSRKSTLPSFTPHRFEAIHQQKVQTDTRANPGDTTPAQRSFSKGYADGLDTAKTFAAVNKSKLGFTGQFIQDAIGSAGPSVVAPGTEENYGRGFRDGLAEGEARFL